MAWTTEYQRFLRSHFFKCLLGPIFAFRQSLGRKKFLFFLSFSQKPLFLWKKRGFQLIPSYN